MTQISNERIITALVASAITSLDATEKKDKEAYFHGLGLSEVDHIASKHNLTLTPEGLYEWSQ